MRQVRVHPLPAASWPAGALGPRVRALLAALAAGLAAGGIVLGVLLLDGEAPPPASPPLAESAAPLLAGAEAEIEGRIRVLAALAASPVLDRPGADLRALHAHARAAAGTLEAPVVVADLSLAQLVHTNLPFGTILPGLPDPALALQALEGGRPAMGLGRPGREGAAPLLIAVPVKRGRATVAVLMSELQPATLGSVLDRLVPARTAAALLDAEGRIAAAGTRTALPPLPAALTEQGRLQAAGSSFDYVAQELRAVPHWRLVLARPMPPPPPWLTRPRLVAALSAAVFAAVLAALAARRHGAPARLEVVSRGPAALGTETPAMLALARPPPQAGSLPAETAGEARTAAPAESDPERGA